MKTASTQDPSAPLDPINCDLSHYRVQEGLDASLDGNELVVSWDGEGGSQLRLRLAIRGGVPLVRELAIKKPKGEFAVLGLDLVPEFHVTSGLRRISEQQLAPLRDLGHEITPELIDEHKWNAFWDAPLDVPGDPARNYGTPRRPEEIRRADAVFAADGCSVETNGARLQIDFPRLDLGIFAGSLRFTVYRGSNLIRIEAIAKTDEASIAYKYEGGLSGFGIGEKTKVLWRDTGGDWQHYRFGGSANENMVALKARNRLLLIEEETGTIATFPPPHKFFFPREIEVNLGYVWYRKDDDGSFAVGVKHGDREEMFKPYGASEGLREKRIKQAVEFADGNFALYNAPPGSQQHMAFYLYASAETAIRTQEAVLTYTHKDRYKPLSGYQVMVSHYHTHFAEMLTDYGSLDVQPSWLPAFRALGINIALLSDFHGDGNPKISGRLRLDELKTYFDACRRHSDHDFLILPGEEPNVHLGGHYTAFFPHPVYWTRMREDDQPFIEEDAEYGTVYHTGSADDVLELIGRERGLVWQTHPNTKGSTGYPAAIRDSKQFNSDRFIGAAFKSMPVDQSTRRLGETLTLPIFDEMNNWSGPKYLVGETDTYTKYPEDELYGESIVNYVRLDRLPRFDEDWSPITEALQAGRFFVTTGEVLIRDVRLEGEGGAQEMVAEVEWTFPLEFVEVVWGDGERSGNEERSATDLGPFGSHQFRIPIDVTGKKWVRFAAWDSAGNGALAQPIHLKGTSRSDML